MFVFFMQINTIIFVKMKKHIFTEHLDFYSADVRTDLALPMIEGGISAGFPSPAADYLDLSLDLNKELVRNPSSTFFGRVKGSSMKDAGINDGDVLVIDKSIIPFDGATAVCFIDGEFTLKRIQITKDALYLVPANDTFKPICITSENDFLVWGVVTYVIKKM